MPRRASKPILVYLSTETIGKEVFNILKLSQNFRVSPKTQLQVYTLKHTIS